MRIVIQTHDNQGDGGPGSPEAPIEVCVHRDPERVGPDEHFWFHTKGDTLAALDREFDRMIPEAANEAGE